MKYYIKNALFGFAYLVLMDLMSILVIFIGSAVWKAIVAFISILFYCFVIGTVYFKEGETAFDILRGNDIQRRKMVETGKLTEIDTVKEYKPYKGFIIGALICAPLVFILLLHLIIGLASGGTLNGAGIVATFAYFMFFTPINAFYTETLAFADYFIILYALAVTSLATGISYILGAKKSQRKYDMIERKHREIYGDEN